MAWRIGLNSAERMQYRIQFLDGRESIIRELTADARNAIGAVALLTEFDWLGPRVLLLSVCST